MYPGNSCCSSHGCWPDAGRRSAPGRIPAAGGGFGLSQATSYRYVAEGTKVVSAEAPGLEEALERAVTEGTPYVILDGKIVSSGRCHEKTASQKGRDIDLW